MTDATQPNEPAANDAQPAEPLIKIDPQILAQIGEAMGRVMQEMPHLCAAVSRAVADIAGEPIPIALVVFGQGFAMHGSNVAKDESDRLVVSYAEALKRGGGSDAAG